jgi:hypothetical protein
MGHLERAFCNHFEGANTKPGTSWDLMGCKREAVQSLGDYINRFMQRKNQLQEVSDSNIINAFTVGVKNEALIRDIGRKKNISIRDMFDLAHEHTDGEDCFNTSNGKYKSCLVNKMDQSSSAKKDRKRRGEFCSQHREAWR